MVLYFFSSEHTAVYNAIRLDGSYDVFVDKYFVFKLHPRVSPDKPIHLASSQNKTVIKHFGSSENQIQTTTNFFHIWSNKFQTDDGKTSTLQKKRSEFV